MNWYYHSATEETRCWKAKKLIVLTNKIDPCFPRDRCHGWCLWIRSLTMLLSNNFCYHYGHTVASPWDRQLLSRLHSTWPKKTQIQDINKSNKVKCCHVQSLAFWFLILAGFWKQYSSFSTEWAALHETVWAPTCSDRWVSSWRWPAAEVSSLALLSRLLLMPREGGLLFSSAWPGDGSRNIFESIFVSISFLLSFLLHSSSNNNDVLRQEFPFSLACCLPGSSSSRPSVECARDSSRTASIWLGISSVWLERLEASSLITWTYSFEMTWAPSVCSRWPRLFRSPFHFFSCVFYQ